MKYAIQPVLKEIEEFVEAQGWDEIPAEWFHETAQQTDTPHLEAATMAILLHKLYKANQ